MDIKKTIFAKNGLINKYWTNAKSDLLTKGGSITQSWLNNRKMPRKGGKPLHNNTIEYSGLDCIKMSNENGIIQCSPFNQGIFRVYLRNNRTQHPWHDQNSWTIDLKNTGTSGWKFTKRENTASYSHSLTGKLTVKIEINAAKGTLSTQIGPDIIMTDSLAPQTAGEWLFINKRLIRPGIVKIFGLGENTQPMNKAGQKIIMWNSDRANYKKGCTPLYQSWPVAIFQYHNGPAFGLVFDNPAYAVFNFSRDGKDMSYNVEDTELNYFLLLGPTLPDVMEQLTTLTGGLKPLPKWALGYQQSRWSYIPSTRVREVAKQFRKRDIPCDTIYLDIDYMEQFKCFTWGKDFTDFKEMITDLHNQGFKVIPIIDPGLKIEPGYSPYETGIQQEIFITNKKGNPVTKKVWAGSSHFPDFINESAGTWWADLISKFAASKIDGIWCDMNEPSTFDCRRTLPGNVIHKLDGKLTVPHKKVHNVYGFLMSKATYEGLLKTTELPYIVTRSTYLGGQKYAATWTGDNSSTWEHYRASIPMILNLGLSGQPVSGPDIGGFKGTPSPELYERWILQGALYPYCRSHTSQGTGDQEPWSFGKEVEKSARDAIKLRYRLIPYLYTLLYRASREGQPVMRPIFYHAPTGEALRPEYYETEFLLGPHLLVAPLMDKAPTRSCYIPPGDWYSWWCREERQGGKIYRTTTKDTQLPLFIQENAVIPMYPEAPAFIPDKSLDDLEIILTVKNEAKDIIVDYFDNKSLFAYKVAATAKQNKLEIKMDILQEGPIPAGYRPVKKLHLLLNHKTRKIKFHSIHGGYTVLPDTVNDSWSRITITNPVFPLKADALLD
jgi:alpha-glucosidase